MAEKDIETLKMVLISVDMEYVAGVFRVSERTRTTPHSLILRVRMEYLEKKRLRAVEIQLKRGIQTDEMGGAMLLVRVGRV